jgi:nitrite reductase (NADH) large subunit
MHKEAQMKIVIVGAGPAGVTVVETIRGLNCDAELIMLSAEPHPPYSPPAMLDHFLTGSKAHLWRGEDWPKRLGLDYRSGTTATKIEPEAHRLQTSDGELLEYDKLVVATGSRLYAPLEGVDLPGVYNFKSFSAAQALVQKVKSGEAQTAVIIGAGFIGVEIALLLSELGVSVTQIEMLDQVMPGMLDAETADFVLQGLNTRGVDVRLETKAVALVGDDYATGVKLESGETLDADLMIAATGVRPNLELLEGSGIAYKWGITVDECLRTSDPDVYAAGDVVEAPDRLTGETYVHAIFPNATAQGTVVGLNLAGYEVPYEGADRMNSLKHLGLPIMAVGLKEGDEILRTKRNGSLRTLYLKENRLVGFQLVGDVRSAGVLRAMMIRGQDVGGIKDNLLDRNFGQGMVAWKAMLANQ